MTRTIVSLLLILFLFISCADSKSKRKAPKAVKGILDLRGSGPLTNQPSVSNENSSKNEPSSKEAHMPSNSTQLIVNSVEAWDFEKDGPINLDGEWEFYFGELIEPNTPVVEKQANNNSKIEIRNSTESIPHYIPVPSQWQREGYSEDGFATYKLKILLPDNFLDGDLRQPLQKRHLSIAMPDTGTAYAMYVNGALVSVNGKVGKSFVESEPYLQFRTFSIDKFIGTEDREGEKGKLPLARQQSRINKFHDNEIEILVHLSNFHYSKAGIWSSVKLGSTIQLEKEAKKKFVLDLVVISALLTLGLYHFGLYLNRRKDSAPLFFAIFCVLTAIRTLNVGERMLLDAFPFLLFSISHKLEFISFFYSAFVFLQFLHSLFPKEASKTIYRLASIVLIPCSLVAVIFPMSIYSHFLIIVQIIILILVFYMIVILIIAIQRGTSGAKLFFWGFILSAGAIVNDVLLTMDIINTVYIASYGLLIFIFFQSIILSRRFASGFVESEKLSEDLEKKTNEISDLMHDIENKISIGIKEQQKFTQILLDLNKSDTINQTGFLTALKEVTETCSDVLKLDQCSIWMTDNHNTILRCIDKFLMTEGIHEEGSSFVISDFPIYFSYFEKGLIISASDVYKHPAEVEFNEIYHRPLGIQSIVEMPIISGGNLLGVFVCETIREKKYWTSEEEAFVSSLAGILAGYFELNEKQKTFLELNDTKREIENLNTFAHIVNSLPDLNSIFIEISKYFYYTFKISGIWLFLPDEKREYLHAYRAYSYSKLPEDKYNYLLNKKIPLREDIGGMIYKTYKRKKAFHLSKIPKLEDGIDKEIVDTLSIKSLLFVPLVRKEECVGLFSFSNLENEMKLTKSEMRKISNLCSHIAGAIDTNYLLQQVEQAKRKTETLNQLIKKVNETSDLEQIMQIILSHVKKEYKLPYYSLFILDPKENILKYSNAVLPEYVSLEDKEVMRKNSMTLSAQNEDSIHSRALTLKIPIFIEDIEKEIKTENGKALFKILKHKSFITLPIILENNPIGALDFISLEPIQLKEEEITELSLLSEQLAGVINSSILFKQIQEEKFQTELAKQEIETLNEFTKLINSTSDITLIYKEIYAYLNLNFGNNILWILLVDKEKNEMYSDENMSHSQKGDSFDFEYFKNFRMSINEKLGTLYKTYLDKVPLYVPDLSIWDKETKAFTNQFNGEKYDSNKLDLKIKFHGKLKSILQIPLIVQNEVVGIFNITNYNELLKLSREEIEKLVRFTNQVAGVIHNAQLLKQTEDAKLRANIEKGIAQIAQEESEKARKESEKLNKLLRNVNSVSGLIDIMTFIMVYLEKEYNFYDFSLLLKDNEKEQIIPFSFTSSRISAGEREYFMEWNLPFEKASGIFTNILENKKLFYIEKENIPEEDSIAKEWITKGTFDYLLFLPLVIYDELIGILFLHTPKKEMTISKGVLTKLERFSELIAGSVFNAQLLKKVEESREFAEFAKGEAEAERSIALIAQMESEAEREKSEKLLLNILPKDVARELKDKGFAEPELYENVSVMFTDFKGFTQIAETLTPHELIKDLDACFVQFDKITERYSLEKLKTIGDSYMCAGGIPRRNKTHAIDCCLAALEIQAFMNLMKKLKEEKGFPYWELRLGIHTGPLVAGVIGERKFAYDVWGDTVNTASRMESSGTTGKINISSSTYEYAKDVFDCEYRGEVNAKNKGVVKMYYLNRIKEEFSKDEKGLMPNGKFWALYG